MFSFDVFDTLITRITKNPQGVFYIMQERISAMDTWAMDALTMEREEKCFLGRNFAQIRMNAEREAGAYSLLSKEKTEVNLEAVYEAVMQMTGISAHTKNALMEMEIQTEIDCAVGIRENISKLKQAAEKGEHVVLISDMYLSSRTIRKILVSVDSIFESIPIYVSNECGCTKYTGELFLYVKEKEKIAFHDWIHYGDNEISDVKSPKKLGIRAVELKKSDLLPWEKEFDGQNALETNAYWQLYTGIARTLRQNRRMTSAEEMGSSVGGMILYPYVEWVIHNSLKLNIHILYFIARDGFILKKIADIIIRDGGLEMKTKYIYGSRIAWRIPDGCEEKKENLRLYLRQEIDCSEKFAFVEVNGTGYTMECLADFIRELCDQRIYAFYFSLKKRTERPYCSFFTYLTAYDEIVEVLCRAPHGPTMGYEKKDGKMVPEIQSVEEKLWENAGLPGYIDGVLWYAESMIRMQLKWHLPSDNRCLVSRIVKYISKHPQEQVLRFLADMPHNNGYSDGKSAYAPALSGKDLFHIFMWRTNEPLGDFYTGVNYEFSELLLTKRDKKIIDFYKHYYYRLPGRLIHRYKGWSAWRRGDIKEKRKRVMIYAAGTVGQRVYHFASGEAGYRVVAWVDREYKSYRRQGYPVSGLKAIGKKKFDMIVIAIQNAEVVQGVRKMLTEKGVSPEKIFDAPSFYAMAEKKRTIL